MATMSYVALFVVVLAASLNSSHGVSEENKTKLRESLRPVFAECGKEHDVSMEQLEEYKEKKTIPKETCFIACILKKTGFMNDEGKFDPESSLEKLKKYSETDEETKNVEEAVKVCTKVNDEVIANDDKGCERSALLMKCLHEQAVKYGFTV